MGVTSSGVDALSTPLCCLPVFERKPVVLPATLPQAYGPNVMIGGWGMVTLKYMHAQWDSNLANTVANPSC